MKTLIAMSILSMLLVEVGEARVYKIPKKTYPVQCYYQVPLDKFLSGNYTVEDLKNGQKECLLRNSK